MNKLHKRLLAVLIACTFVLTGCKGSNKDYLSTTIDSEYEFNISPELTLGKGISEKVCIIDTDTVSNNYDSKINVKSALLFNITDNKVVYNKNIFNKMYPASTTKILTAYVAIKYAKINGIDFDKQIVVTDVVKNMVAGAKLSGLYPGDTMTLRDVMYCTLLESGNDAALIVAENIAGSVEKFVELMNLEAKKMGATNSNFLNPHGLYEDNHYTTAYDLYLIFNEACKMPEFREYINTKTYTFKYTTASGVIRNRTVNPTNQYLLGQQKAPTGTEIIGGKTGYEELAGRCLAILSNKNGKDYISIILYADSTPNLYTYMNKLLEMEE